MKQTNNPIRVRKNDGELVPLDLNKLNEALRRSGANEEQIKTVNLQVRKSLYDGIPTKSIYQLAYSILRKVSDHSAGRYRLKKALSQLGPSGYPFEHFVAKLLETDGYTTKTGQIIQGKCVQHEVDVLAEKGNKLIMAECKFHRSEGAKSDVKTSLYVRSRYTDIQLKLMEDEKNRNIIFEPMLITNTRFTVDAIQYGTCSGLHLLAWDYPRGNGLKERIDRAKLFPITVLKTLTQKETNFLLDKGVVLCRQILEQPIELNNLMLSSSRMNKLLREAKSLVG